jgi:hypothetical protein
MNFHGGWFGRDAPNGNQHRQLRSKSWTKWQGRANVKERTKIEQRHEAGFRWNNVNERMTKKCVPKN